MGKDEPLYTTIVKKHSTRKYYPSMITIPKPVLEIIKSKPIFFEVNAYPDFAFKS